MGCHCDCKKDYECKCDKDFKFKCCAPEGKSYQPCKLRKGDTIAIVAPASALTPTHIENIKINSERLRKMGFKVVYGKYLTGYEELPFSASVKHRLEDLNNALCDKNIKMVLTARGGYGSMELLPCIDWECFDCDPKIFMGYSDITSLFIPLNKFTNVITYQGPMAGEFWTEKTWEHFENIFVKKDKGSSCECGCKSKCDYRDDCESECGKKDKIVYKNEGTISLRDGCTEGYIYAGHFDTLMALFGTKYELCPKKPYILMVEEIDTSLREIDRMMQTLYLSGILGGACGFVYAKSKTELFTEEELLDILKKHLDKVPWVKAFYGLHFGHFMGNGEHMILPVGKFSYMNASKQCISFKV